MTERNDGLPLKSLILVPALVTLGVTLLRLTGELLHWSPTLFNRAAGGAGAIVGIVWLVPVFGVIFAVKLIRAGQAPTGAGRAIGIPLLALLVVPLTVVLARQVTAAGPVRIFMLCAGSIVCLLVAWRAWPTLARVLFAYGLTARIPVALIMLIAILGNWGTHYELGPPSFPEMAPLPKWFFIGLLPQLTLWMAFTVVIGSLFGGLAALVAALRAKPGTTRAMSSAR